jgi:uncharacterized protein (TIGR02421 family)
MNEIKKIDKKLYNLAEQIEKNYLTYINPTNSTMQRETFFDLIKKHSYLNPNFEYQKQNKLQLTQIEEKIQLIEKQLKSSIAEKILKQKAEDLLLDLHLMQTVNTPKFCNASKKAYGEPNSKLLKKSLEILQTKIENIQEKALSPVEAKLLLEEKMQKVPTGFSVSIEENMSAQASEHIAEKKVKLSSTAIFSKELVEQLFVHEVETHVYRHLNGILQPLKCLSMGAGGEFLRTEEGLAIFNEHKANVSSQNRERTYAGRTIAVNYALKHDFFETFDYLKNFFSDNEAYTITQRVKRGVPHGQKGAFTKDYSYFAGLVEIKEFMNNTEDIKDLYYGKISSKEIKLIKKLPGLVEPKYMPNYLIK